MSSNGPSKDVVAERFGDWLHDQMYKHRLNQPQLAEMLGVNQSTISNWLRGKVLPTPEKTRGLIEIFGIEPATLYGILGVEVGQPHVFRTLGPFVEELDRILSSIEDPRIRALAEDRIRADVRALTDTIESLTELINSLPEE